MVRLRWQLPFASVAVPITVRHRRRTADDHQVLIPNGTEANGGNQGISVPARTEANAAN